MKEYFEILYSYLTLYIFNICIFCHPHDETKNKTKKFFVKKVLIT